MTNDKTIQVEVAYALPHKQKLIQLSVNHGTTALETVRLSGIAGHFPDLDIESNPMGVFGQTLGTKGLATAEQYEMKAGDRIEIYRPLIADPKEARRKRAAKAKDSE